MTTKTTKNENKEVSAFVKKFFKLKKDPSTVALVAVNGDSSAGGWGFGDADELVTGLVVFAKELDEASRYALCCQLMATLPSEGIMSVVDAVLQTSGKLKVKKSKIN